MKQETSNSSMCQLHKIIITSQNLV